MEQLGLFESEATSTCDRCGRPCKSSAPGTAEARILRRARRGLCANCAVTAILQGVETVADGIARNGKACLMDPRVQAQFAALMQAGNADATPDEIDWEIVTLNWDLPIPRKHHVSM